MSGGWFFALCGRSCFLLLPGHLWVCCCVRSPQVDHVRHLSSAMGGGNYEGISTHSVCSNTPSADVAEADAGTQIESMVAIERAPSDDQTILEHEDRRYMLLYSKSKARWAALSPPLWLQLTQMALSAGLYTSYCICKRQYPRFRRHCPQGRRQATVLRRLDP